MEQSPLVSIIIPVFNLADVTQRCIEALLRHPPETTFEIILIDDASTDSNTEYLKKLTRENACIRLLRNDTNLGFARASNRGAEAALGRCLLFLNNDTEVCPDWFPPLFSILENNPEIGIVGPKLIFPDGSIQHCGKIWKDTSGSRSQPHHIYYRAPGDAPFINKSREYQMLTAACILVRRDEFFSIGPFDEGYENGWEDDDLCYAYRAAGKSCYYCAESTVIHHESTTLNEGFKKPENITAEYLSEHSAQREIAGTIPDIEQKLPGRRKRFTKNRQRFFSKWKEYIVRDDYEFYRCDGIPFVTIIIPVFNRIEFTEKCLEALSRTTPAGSYELILVDNGSTDGTADFLRKQDMISLVLTNPKNLGFAKACNQGAEAAHGEYLLFLNNDTEPQPGWLDALLRVIHADPAVGAVGSKLLYPDGTIQHAGVAMVNDRIRQDPLVGKHIYTGKPADLPEANIPFCYQALTAASLMIRRSAFFEVGGFDECFWNGYEDLDLCFRLREKGCLLVYNPDSVLIHHESKSGPERFAKADHNIRLLHEKWLGKIAPDFTITGQDSVIESAKGTIFPYRAANSPSDAAVQSAFVSIVILTFNQLDKTKDCIDSIRKHTPELHEIIFIDNSSSDGTLDMLRELCAGNETYTLIENDENRGFAAGCNQGIRAAKGNYILLLNNDVIVTKGWLDGLLECLRATPDSGIVGPMTNNISGIQQVPDVRYSSTAELDAYAARFRKKNRYQRIPYRRIVGFCMLFRKSLVNEIGLLDEAFGTGNYEDDDFCLRAAIKGYQNFIAGDVFIHHVGSASFRGNNFDYLSTLSDNGRLFREKWSRPITDEEEGKRIITLKTLEKADILYQRGEHDEMIETLLQEGIRQIPGKSSFYLALAGYLLDLGRHKDAFDVLAELPVNYQEESRFVLTGRALAGMGHLEEALSQAEDALRMNARSAQAYYLMGVIADLQKQPTRAESYWKKALDCDPGYGEPCTSLGMSAVNGSHTESTLDLLEQGFLLSPLVSQTALRYHTAASDSGNYERAELLFREMHRIYPQHRTIQFLLIDLLIRQEKTAEALTEIEDACVVFGTSDGMLAAGLELRQKVGPMSIPVEKQGSGTSVSLCMIMKNEQDHLARCLKSLKPVVDEIIITDTGSTDLSREIAELFGARLFEFPWNGDFSAARNVSLEQATGNWILVMDADEVLSVLDHGRFRELVSNSPAEGAAYDIITRNYTFTTNLEKWRPNDGLYPEEAGAGWTPSNKVRLFPNQFGIRFENPVHEMVDLSIAAKEIPIIQTDIPVHHYGSLNKEKQKKKGEMYYLLGKKKLEQSGGNDFRALCELAVQAGEIGRYDEAVELWDRVLQLNPTYPLAHFNKGAALLPLGRFHESRAASAKAMELDPNYFEAANNFAICELCIGGTEEAIRVLETSLNKRPNDPNTLLRLAVAHLCSGDGDTCEEIFTRLTEKGLEYSEFINFVTKKLFEAEKVAQARALLKKAILLRAGNEETGRLFSEFGEKP